MDGSSYLNELLQSPPEENFDGQRNGGFGHPSLLAVETLDHQIDEATRQRDVVVKSIPAI